MRMSALEQLYQQVILDHAKERHGHGLRPAPSRTAAGSSHQYNPLCGDEVTVDVALAGDRVIADVSWEGDGCSISQASTSVMYDLIIGQPLDEARSLMDEFRLMLRSRGSVEPDEDRLGDAAAFVGVGKHANRVKCAMLGWIAFEDALAQAMEAASVVSAAPTAQKTQETHS